jgi:hypothetical protein
VYIVTIFVDVVAQYLLTLLIDGVDVVDDNHLFQRRLVCRARLAKRLHFTAKITDALLLLEIVDKEDVLWTESLRIYEAEIIAYDGIEKGRLSRRRFPFDEQIQHILLHQQF